MRFIKKQKLTYMRKMNLYIYIWLYIDLSEAQKFESVPLPNGEN